MRYTKRNCDNLGKEYKPDMKTKKQPAKKFSNFMIQSKIIKLCENYLLLFRSYVQALLFHVRVTKRYFRVVLRVLVDQVTQSIQSVQRGVDINVKAYTKNRSIMVGFSLLVFIFPLVDNLYLLIPKTNTFFISDYYPNLHYFSFALSDALKPLIILTSIILFLPSGGFIKFYLVAPLSYYIANGLHMLTATNNKEYLNPPTNIYLILFLSVYLSVLLFYRKKLSHRYYHGKKVSSISSLIGIIDCDNVNDQERNHIMKKLAQDIKNNKHLIYKEI